MTRRDIEALSAAIQDTLRAGDPISLTAVAAATEAGLIVNDLTVDEKFQARLETETATMAAFDEFMPEVGDNPCDACTEADCSQCDDDNDIMGVIGALVV